MPRSRRRRPQNAGLARHAATVAQAPMPAVERIDRPKNDRLIYKDEVMRITGSTNTTLWKTERAGTFPRRVAFGSKVAWWESEVLSCMANLRRREYA